MTETLADLEALALSCRSEQSKAYIAEALKCYHAGAYRAAIVTTWIAVVFDLIDKIRELALSGDSIAKELEGQYETYISQIEQDNRQGIEKALEFERNIIGTCGQRLQFFDAQQMIDLERLREDRHRCAHPSFQHIGVPYQPPAEQARLHLRNAIVHVLSQPPIQGKAALAELIMMVSSEYFPTESDKAFNQLQSSSLQTATEALIRGFVDRLIFGFLTEGDQISCMPQVLSALNAVKQMYPGVVEERLTKQLNKGVRDVPDKAFFCAVRLVTGVSQGWDVLEDSAQEKVRRFVSDGPTEEVVSELQMLSRVDALSGELRMRVDTFDLDAIAAIASCPGLGALAKQRALHLLSEVRSWNAANTVFSKAILPIMDVLTREDIERIIRMPVEQGADLPGATGYALFIEKVRDGGPFKEEELNQLLRKNQAGYLLPQEETDDDWPL